MFKRIELAMPEEIICDNCWEPLDDLDLWEMDGDTQAGYMVCSRCEEELHYD